MSLDLNKILPKAGTRYALPTLYGSSDAYALALAAREAKAQGQMLAVIVASASDGQRLLGEMPWFATEQLRCHLLPDWEPLPYAAFSPHQDLVSERLATLHEISSGQCDVMIVPATTALVRMAPPSFLAAYTFFFKQGETLDEARLKSQLTLAGYTHVAQVMSPGEYSVRGGLIDLFPMGSALPYRLDLFGDTIETIRTFDADTQRSLYPVNEVRLLPGREFPMDEAARTTFRNRWREQFEGDPSRSVVYKDISSGIASAGIEYYLPLFFEETATLFDYLPQGAALALVGDIDAAIKRFWVDTQSLPFFEGRPRAPHPRAGSAVPQRRTILHAGQALRAAVHLEGRRHPGLRAVCTYSQHRRQPPQRRSAGQPARLSAAAGPPRDDLRRIERPARNAAAVLQRIRFGADAGRRLRGLRHVRRQVDAGRGAAARRLRIVDARREPDLHHRNRAVCRFRTPCRQEEAGRRHAGRSDGARPVGAEDRRSGGPHQPRHRALHGPDQHGPGRRRNRIPAPRIRQGHQAVCAGVAAARDLALLRRLAGGRAAAFARFRPVGKGQEEGGRAGARHRRRTAEFVRPARAAQGPLV